MKNPTDLAWKGVTPEDKETLLNHLLSERKRLTTAGKMKDGFFGVVSGCVDIINTANAALSDAECAHKKEWQTLLEKACNDSIESLKVVAAEGQEDWSASDYEAAGKIVFLVNKDPEAALGYYDIGLSVARENDNRPMILILLGQVMLADMELDEPKNVASDIQSLQNEIDSSFPPEVLARAYLKLAKGAEYLALHYADKAESPNQRMKIMAN